MLTLEGAPAMKIDAVTSVLTDPVTVEHIERTPLMRIAYTALDGGPRVVPVAYIERAGQFVFCTIPRSAKVRALRRDPRVAITIDSGDPLCCLLVRGWAEVEIVEGVPEEYLAANRRTMSAEAHAGFEQQVRGLYDEMARVVITPSFARLNDFVRTAPRDVERIVAEKSAS
jgi:hypothetical protein